MFRGEYSFSQLLFSLRKEYLNNIQLLNRLLSYIKFRRGNKANYNYDIRFKEEANGDIKSLILLVYKRQSFIRHFMESLGNLYFYTLDNYMGKNVGCLTFLNLDDSIIIKDENENSKVGFLPYHLYIENEEEFIKLYNNIINSEFVSNKGFNITVNNSKVLMSPNGIQLYHNNIDYRNTIVLDYDGIGDNLSISDSSYLDLLMNRGIPKDMIPPIYRDMIDEHLEDFDYHVLGNMQKKQSFDIDSSGKDITLIPRKR